MTKSTLSFVHWYEPGLQPEAPTILALHGTGGNEHDLVPLARELRPDAAILSPRGQVLERGMPRFFKRLAEGVFDLDDLRQRTADLAAFVAAAADHYQFDPKRVVAMGFSNGANIAASLLLVSPQTLGGAVLFRAQVPLVPNPLPSIPGTPVLLSNGTADPLVSRDETERLTSLLRDAGARVEVELQPAGHNLVADDITSARNWLQRNF